MTQINSEDEGEALENDGTFNEKRLIWRAKR